MPPAHRPPELVGRVFLGRVVCERGLLTPDQLRSAAWRRLFRGVYVDADLPDTHGVRISAARLVLPGSAVVSGRSAAWLLGVHEAADATTPVEVAVPRARRFGPVTGLRIRQAEVADADIDTTGKVRHTGAVRTACDLARHEPLAEAVALVDVALARGLVRLTDLQARVGGLGPGPGRLRTQRAVELADARAESLPESKVRVVLACAGLIAVPQFEVRDTGGRWLARVDLAFPELRIAIEYDGAWHGEKGRLAQDRRRLNRLVEAGWLVLHLTAADLYRPDEVVARVRALIATRVRDTGPRRRP